MSFQPVLPFTGYTGWTFLKRTLATQQAAMAATPIAQRDEAYFRSKIENISSADELVEDRRLLRITLTAFGLEGDIENRAFIRKILESRPDDSKALANRLSDKRYLALSKSFDFHAEISHNQLPGFADKIIVAFQQRSFESAVGDRDETMRLALNAQRELGVIAAGNAGATTKWYAIMGSLPLRTVVESAFGLPSGFGQLDIDQQLRTFKHRSLRLLGSADPSILTNPDTMEKLIRTYLIRVEAANGMDYSRAQAALQLLGR